MPYEIVAPRLMALGVGPEVWEAVKPNVTRLADAADLAKLVTGPVTPVIEDAGLCSAGRRAAAARTLGREDLGRLDQGGRGQTGAKGRALFHPLRLALTGREHGPELKKLLPLIGRAAALARLEGKAA